MDKELPRKMWTTLEPDLEPLANEQRKSMERQIEEMVRNCTDDYIQAFQGLFQGSFMSPPSTPHSLEPPKEPPTMMLKSRVIPVLKSLEQSPADASLIPSPVVHNSSPDLPSNPASGTVVPTVHCWRNWGSQFSSSTPALEHVPTRLFDEQEDTHKRRDQTISLTVVDQLKCPQLYNSELSNKNERPSEGDSRLPENSYYSYSGDEPLDGEDKSRNVDFDAIFSSILHMNEGQFDFDI
jgi:hypothetical protein